METPTDKGKGNSGEDGGKGGGIPAKETESEGGVTNRGKHGGLTFRGGGIRGGKGRGKGE